VLITVARLPVFMFQLLSKNRSNIQSKCPSAQHYLLTVDSMMACVTDEQQQIRQTEALYVLANRYLELHRYTVYSVLFHSST